MTFKPYFIHGADRPSRWLVTCDHAANTVPPSVNGGDLGLPPSDMARHIAYDPGAAGVSRHLAAHLNGPEIETNFSRLVIDPNRGLDDPTLLMRLYDGSVIPANARADLAERDRRIAECYTPYHSALAELAARQDDTVIVAIHSYTPQLRGRPPRPWHIGILFAHDRRLSDPLLALLRAQSDLCVGENEPYGGHLPGDSIDRHAEAMGRPSVLIELRNDLIATDDLQRAWAARLAPLLETALAQAGL